MRTPAKNSQPFARHNLSGSEQLTLVHEDITDVTRSLVAALGGAKVIGPRLYPQKSAEQAARYLLDCLNPNRDHDIGLEGFVTLLRWAREGGIHLAIHWLCDEAGYSRPTPIEPEDARAQLQREFSASVEKLEALAKRLGK